jgi:flagellar assembly protein FliH
MERVLKAERVAGWARRRISGQEWQAGERAAALLADARAEAAALLRDAERELAQRRAAADRDGHAEGVARAAVTLLEAQARRDRWLAAAEPEVVELGLEVARRLLGRELALDAAAVRGCAVEALAAARGRHRACLRLHPAAAEALRGEGGALGAVAGLASLELVADPGLSPGDALVETEVGGVDGRLEVRLEAFRRALAEAA